MEAFSPNEKKLFKHFGCEWVIETSHFKIHPMQVYVNLTEIAFLKYESFDKGAINALRRALTALRDCTYRRETIEFEELIAFKTDSAQATDDKCSAW